MSQFRVLPTASTSSAAPPVVLSIVAAILPSGFLRSSSGRIFRFQSQLLSRRIRRHSASP
eukprot:2547763-Lingulodinium_polyedra.AAC.1